MKKEKWIHLVVTEEQHKKIREASFKDAIDKGSRVSTSAFVIDIVMTHLNGNTPPTHKETIPETQPDVPKLAGPITSFNDIEI
jgi:hypothetical protein